MKSVSPGHCDYVPSTEITIDAHVKQCVPFYLIC